MFYNGNQFITKAIDMHNFYAKYAKILDISKHLSKNLGNKSFQKRLLSGSYEVIKLHLNNDSKMCHRGLFNIFSLHNFNYTNFKFERR